MRTDDTTSINNKATTPLQIHTQKVKSTIKVNKMKYLIMWIVSFIRWIDNKFNKYRYTVNYRDQNGNRYKLFFETWSDANECAANAFNSGRIDVTIKIK